MTTEAEARIREALEKAPTHGEWIAYRMGGKPEVSHAIPPFIAACNPTNIAALLADRDEREAKITRERDEARAALASIAEGCSFPADDVQRAIRDRARAALAQIEQERSEQAKEPK